MADSYAFLVGKNPYTSEQLTVSTTPVLGTTAKVDNHARANGSVTKAAAAVVQAVANGVFYTLDGSTPSGTNGFALAAGETLPLAGYGKIKNLRMVRSGASDATVYITYYN